MRKKILYLLIVPTFILLFAANAFAADTVTDMNSLGQYIYKNMQNYVSPITVNYTNTANINYALRNNILSGAFLQDDYTAASYSDITFREMTNSVNPSSVELIITPTYVETAEQEAYVNQQVAKIVASVVQPGMTDYQKVAALHDWVVSHVTYDTTLQDISDYAALADGKTICRGYSMLLYKLLTNAGFNAHIVIGEVRTGFRFRHSATGHAWNMVQLNGSWYFIDATNDGLSTDAATKFFLVGGRVLQENGFSWDQTKYPAAFNNYGSTTSTAISAIRITGLAYSTDPAALSLIALYSDGRKCVVPSSQAAWTSSNPDVAAVDSNGVVSFTGNNGYVTIKAVVGNISSTAALNVHYTLGISKIEYSTAPQPIQMYKVYSDGVIVPASGSVWESSDTSIATVDGSGNLRFTGITGDVTLKGTYNNQTISEQIIVCDDPCDYFDWELSPYFWNDI